jgi:hypothetical protein
VAQYVSEILAAVPPGDPAGMRDISPGRAVPDPLSTPQTGSDAGPGALGGEAQVQGRSGRSGILSLLLSLEAEASRVTLSPISPVDGSDLVPVGEATPAPPRPDQALSRAVEAALARRDLEAVRAAFAVPPEGPQQATESLLRACLDASPEQAFETLRLGGVAFWNTAPWERVEVPLTVMERLRQGRLDAILLARCNPVPTHADAPASISPDRPLPDRLAWFKAKLPPTRGLVAFEVHHDETFEVPHALSKDPTKRYAEWMLRYANGEKGTDLGGVTDTWLSEKLVVAATPGKGVLGGRGRDRAKLSFDPSLAGPLDEAGCQRVDFFGTLLGKALWRGLAVPEMRLWRPLLTRLAGREVAPSLDVLETLDEDLARSIRNTADTNKLPDAALSSADVPFGIPDPAHPGEMLPLDPADPDKVVTPSNRGDFVRLAVERGLACFEPAMEIFARAVYAQVPQALLRSFTDAELERLVAGETRVDLADLRYHTRVVTPFFPRRPAAVAPPAMVKLWFFNILEAWQKGDVPSLRGVDAPVAERRRLGASLIGKLLWQITGASAPPLGGFANLRDPFTLMALVVQTERPNVHTCFHRLDVPGLPLEGGERRLETILLACADRSGIFTDA